MDGIITGKYAYAYEEEVFARRINRKNGMVNRHVKKSMTVGDFGCGTGIGIEFVRTRAKKIIGIDASQDMVDICNKKFPDKHITFMKSDIKHINLKDKYFDLIIIKMTFHHIKDQQQVIHEAYRLLKKNGTLIIFDKFRRVPKWLTFVDDLWKSLSNGEQLFKHHYSTYSTFSTYLARFKILEKRIVSSIFYDRVNLVLRKM